MNKYKIIYICGNCKAEISQGAIVCPNCHKTDPNIEVVGVIPTKQPKVEPINYYPNDVVDGKEEKTMNKYKYSRKEIAKRMVDYYRGYPILNIDFAKDLLAKKEPKHLGALCNDFNCKKCISPKPKESKCEQCGGDGLDHKKSTLYACPKCLGKKETKTESICVLHRKKVCEECKNKEWTFEPESDKENKWNDKQFDVPDVEENGTTKPKESKCECKREPFGTILVEDVKFPRCPDCHKLIETKPQEELEVEELKSHEGEETNGTRETIERLIAIIREHTDKQNELIKAHNALVKEVRK